MSDEDKKSAALRDLPVDELTLYGRELGLKLDAKMAQGELLRLVRERQELLLELDREALLDVVVWARRPVRKSASKEELAKEIASIKKMDLPELSLRGLVTLARLQGLPADENEPRVLIEQRIRDREPLVDRITRKRRQIMGSLVSKMLTGSGSHESESYRFLPEDGRNPSLKQRIEGEGLVGGIASRLRGAADDYVHEKMDEIEERIDRKLDEIDQRLAEWRDREVANRLRIIKITLIASVLVALLSICYSYIRPWLVGLARG